MKTLAHIPLPNRQAPREPWSVEIQVHSFRNFRDAERIDLIWDPAPGRRTGALGDGVDVCVPLIP